MNEPLLETAARALAEANGLSWGLVCGEGRAHGYRRDAQAVLDAVLGQVEERMGDKPRYVNLRDLLEAVNSLPTKHRPAPTGYAPTMRASEFQSRVIVAIGNLPTYTLEADGENAR